MSDLAVTPELLGVEIRELTRQAKAMTVYYAVEIGRRLTAAKSMVPHGGWADWIHENTEFSQTTATRMMRIFDEYGAAQIGIFGAEPNSSTLQNLSISNALRLLAVPEDEREEFAEAIDAENLSARELDKAIRERDAAVADRDNARREANVYSLRTKKAEEELQEAMERAQTLEDDLKAARNDRRQIADELEALRKRPVEVAVQRDEKAIREAAAKAKAEADASWEKKKRELDKQAETTQQELVRTRKETELLKEQLAEAKKKAEAATGTGEKRKILDEIEALKRKLAMADTAVTAARLYFEQWQKVFHELARAVASIEDEEKAEKLRAAIKAQLAAWEKKMGLTDDRMPTPAIPELLGWRTDRDFPEGPVLLLISENGSILYETDDVHGGHLGWFEEPDDGEILRWLPLPEDTEEGGKA
jgi:hypothetical protein